MNGGWQRSNLHICRSDVYYVSMLWMNLQLLSDMIRRQPAPARTSSRIIADGAIEELHEEEIAKPDSRN